MKLITIGNLAKTYHLLPSDVLERATTFDIMVTDIMMSWENYQKNPADASFYREEDLKTILERSR